MGRAYQRETLHTFSCINFTFSGDKSLAPPKKMSYSQFYDSLHPTFGQKVVNLLERFDLNKSWKTQILRKYDLWLVIPRSNIDLGSKNVRPFARSRREQFAGFYCEALRCLVWKRLETFGQKVVNLLEPVKNVFLDQNANKKHQRREMTNSTKWLSRFFKILSFWPPKFKIFDFFRKMATNPKFSKFSKNRIYVTELPIVNHHAKFQPDISIFDPQIVYFSSQKYTQWWRHNSKYDFWEF